MNKNQDKVAVFIRKMLKLFHLKVNEKTENLFIQIFKFVIVGGIATIIDFVSIFIFKEIFNIPVIISNSLAFVIATIYNYIASVRWVFNVNQDNDKRKTFILFVLFSGIGLIISDVIIWITSDIFNIHYMLGKIIATCFVMVFNFITRKLFLE